MMWTPWQTTRRSRSIPSTLRLQPSTTPSWIDYGRWWHGMKRTRYIIMNWDPDAYGGYLDPAPGYQYEDGPIAESNFGFALSNSTAEFVFEQLYTYENNDEDLGATFE